MGIITLLSILLLSPVQWTIAQAGHTATREREVFDTVLMVSVDGSFHALNRTSGSKLWSSSSFQLGPKSEDIASLPPLIHTEHTKEHGNKGSDPYIIEPQSGEIYVVNSTDGSIQRFPWSVPEIVEKSPFTVPGEEGIVFTGRKETKLLLLDVETGNIKHKRDSSHGDKCVDRHTLRGLTLERTSSMEVFIQRTDYHISLSTQDSNGNGTRRIVQNLLLSVYSAKDKDSASQAAYQVTADSRYFQGIAKGEVYSFERLSNNGQVHVRPLWTQNLHIPTVAVFDVLAGPSPLLYVLLQPRLQVEDLIPNIDPKTLPSKDSAYIGEIKDTRSLYVLTSQYYPLAVLGGKPNHEQYRGDTSSSSVIHL